MMVTKMTAEKWAVQLQTYTIKFDKITDDANTTIKHYYKNVTTLVMFNKYDDYDINSSYNTTNSNTLLT